MTSVISPWLADNAAYEYAAVAPTSPEADATFIESISYSPSQSNLGSDSTNVRAVRKQMSKKSYSNEDFDGSYKTERASSSCRTWNDTALDLGQWTTSAAETVATSILSTTKQISSQLQSSKSSPRVTFQTQEGHHPRAFGRGIDRDYLRDSPHHNPVQSRSFVGYLGELTARFTAPKIETGKAKWLE